MSQTLLRLPGALELPENLKGGVVAIGNFDGVHRGHQAVLGEAAALARRIASPLICLTFEPHPRSVFRPDQPVARLTPAGVKARILDALGFDAVVEQAFDRAFAAHTPEAFVGDVLLGALGARHVIVGYDFRYGARRGGDAMSLLAEGRERGFGVSVVEEYDDEGGSVVSSSRIRADLAAGNVAGANALLGYRWTVEGQVGHGRKLGRTLGYPTANMELPDEMLLDHGIYAVRLRRADGTFYNGVASHGRRPTFDNGRTLFETHLFDFSGDLYGENVAVSIFTRLRGEEKFDDVAALVAQMDRDAAAARDILRAAVPLGDLDRIISF